MSLQHCGPDTMTDQFDDPIDLITPTGGRRRLRADPPTQMHLWASLLLAGQSGYVEVAPGSRDQTGRLSIRRSHRRDRYVAAGDTAALVRRAVRWATTQEVFAGPLRGSARIPGSGGVTGGMVAWVDIDDPGALERLDAFRPAPCLVVASGGSGGAHAFWRLARRLPGRAVETLNLQLARRLDGDEAVRDRGRILRLPGTINGKSGRPCRIVRADLRPGRHDVEALATDLGALRTAGRARRRPAPQRVQSDPLAYVAPPVYFAALCGVEVPRGGMVRCPLPDHEDRCPSCRVWPAAERGWWCYGCARGGRLHDLASLMLGGPWGRELRGEAFALAAEHARQALGAPSPRAGVRR